MVKLWDRYTFFQRLRLLCAPHLADVEHIGRRQQAHVGLRVVVPLDINFYPIVLERRPK